MRAVTLVPDPALDSGGIPRSVLVERWHLLTREILPAMAAEEHWPIRFDHCFMRVCLDDAMGRPWTEVVRRPAIATMSDAQLAAAVRTAEGLVERPDTLPVLNERSLFKGEGRLDACAELTSRRGTERLVARPKQIIHPCGPVGQTT